MDNERGPREPHLIASPARFRSARGIGLVIDRLIRGCQQQSIELANWPFGTIAKVVAPDQDQSAALDQLRLGRVDKLNPDADGGKQHECGEALGQFVVAGGDPT